MRKRIYCILMTTILLLCSGCWINYDKLSNEEILVKFIKCSEEQAQHIANTLEECGVGKIQYMDLEMLSVKNRWRIDYFGGSIVLKLDEDKNVEEIWSSSEYSEAIYLFKNNKVEKLLLRLWKGNTMLTQQRI